MGGLVERVGSLDVIDVAEPALEFEGQPGRRERGKGQA
jgi:hypothetical protein